MAYLRIVLMLKALSVKIEIVWSSLFDSSAMVTAASSARLMVCLSSCDLISMCVMVCVLGQITEAPSTGLPVICEPSV